MRLTTILWFTLLAACSVAGSTATVRPMCSEVDFEGDRFTVCAAQPGRHTISLVDRGPDGAAYRDFAPLAPQSRNIAFAMNAGMFDEQGFPIGLYVESGRELKRLNRAKGGSGNFQMQPNGVFYGDASGWHVVTTTAYAATRPVARFATQSGPMLVIDGKLNPQFDANGPSRYVRNGVGVTANGTAWFAISTTPVSLGRFARLFRDRLKTPNALFFDGFVSRLWDPPRGRMDGGPKIGPIVVVVENR